MRQSRFQSRFQRLGFSTKLGAGLVVILLTFLSLGLGFIAFGGFLYLHLLLRASNRPMADMPEGAILAPIDGTIIDVRREPSVTHIDIVADSFASQIFYAPVGGVVDDKLWVDGVYLDYEDAAATLMNAHYSYRIATNFGIPVTLSVMGGAFTRFIHMPFEEGQSLQAGEAFGFALLRGCITMSIPAHMRVPVSKGQSCFATQTCLAQI